MTRVKILKISALVLGALLVVVWNLRHYRQPSSPPPEHADLVSVLPGATRFESHLDPVAYYQGFFPDGRPAGVAFVTSRIPPRVRGFTSEISILVGMTPAGVISRLEILHHQETPSYFRMVLDSGLLQSFLGIDLKSGFPELDAVSGATISSQAMIRDLETSAREVAEKVYGFQVPDSPADPKRKFPYLEPFLVFLLFLSVPVSRRLSRFREARLFPFILGFFIIGLYLNSPLSLNHIVNLLSLRPPAFSVQPGLFLLLFLALVSSLFFGNVFCSYLCPFGAVLEIGARIFPKRIQVDPENIKKAVFLRSLLLFIVIAGVFGFGLDILAQLEPYPYLFAPAKSPLLWLYLTLTVLFSLVFRRLWCRILCPTGAFLDLISRRKKPGAGSQGRGDRPTDQQTNRPADQQTSRPTDQQTSRPTDQQTSRPADQQTNRPADQQTNRPADQQTNRPTDQQTNRPTDQQTNRPTDQQTSRPADQQTSRPADQQTNRPADQQTNRPADRQFDAGTDTDTGSK